MLDLHAATGDRDWLTHARELMDSALEHFWDERAGAFFYTADHGEPLFVRPKDALDNPLPSGNGTAALVLFDLADRTGESRYADRAAETLEALAGWAERAPYGAETMVLATAVYLGRRGRAPTRARSAAAVAERHPVKVAAAPARTQVVPGDTLQVTLHIEIAPGWHINCHRCRQEYLVPTSVEAIRGSSFTVGPIDYPDGRDIEVAGDTLSVYDGRLTLAVPLTALPDAPPGAHSVTLALQFQACDDARCLPPDRVEVEVPLAIAAEGPSR
jgi:hypothetical protein